MALSLTFSNNTTHLLELLAKDLVGHKSDPLKAPTILLPNNSWYKWLQLRLAERNGIVLGYQQQYLEQFIMETFDLSENRRVLTAPILRQFIIRVLKQQFHQENSDYKVINDYLRQAESKEPNANKLVALSTKLAMFFLEYDLNRPGVWNLSGELMVPGFNEYWENSSSDQYFFGAHTQTARETEHWQRLLYRELFSEKGFVLQGVDDIEYLSLPALFREKMALGGIHNLKLPKSTIYLFSPSGMSHFHRNFLQYISSQVSIHIFQLNPCSDFWEDVDTRKNSGIQSNWKSNEHSPLKFKNNSFYQSEELTDVELAQSDQPSSFASKDMKLLELWGHTGKENITLWCQASDYDFNYVEEENSQSHLLAQIQKLIRNRQNSANPKLPLDDSVQFFTAPEILRECEQLRENIHKELQKNKDLTLQDICVYVPNIESYKPFLEKALKENNTGFSPAYEIDCQNTRESLFANGFIAFLNLWGSRMNRKSILEFFRNPLVLSACNMTREDLLTWETWITDLNIFHSWNKSHRENLREAKPSDIHSWEWGIQRLVLGGVTEDVFIADDQKISPFRNMHSGDEAILEAFASLVENLFLDIQAIEKMARGDISQFLEFINAFCTRWFDTSSDPLEKMICSKFLGEINELLIPTESFNIEFDISLLNEILKSILEKELPEKASLFTGPLTIRPLKPGNILPHKISFVCGLNHKEFPGVDKNSTLDLLSQKRIIGDQHPQRNNQYCFLEMLVQTQDTLILSWIDQDIYKDAELPPSSVVLEFTNWLNQYVLNESLKVQKVPLVEHEIDDNTQNFHSLKPEAITVANVLANKKQQTFADRKDFWPELAETLVPTIPKLSINALTSFMDEPLTHILRKEYGFYLTVNDEDASLKEWEPQEANQLDMWKMLDTLVMHIFAASNFNDSFHDTIDYDSILETQILAGNCPEGIMLDLWKHDCKTYLEERIELFQEKLSSMEFDSFEYNVPFKNFCCSQKSQDEDTQKLMDTNEKIPMLAYKNGDLYLICRSTSSLFQSEKFKPKKAKEFISPWLTSLWIRSFSDNPNQKIVAYFIEGSEISSDDAKPGIKEIVLPPPHSTTDNPEEIRAICREFLINLLKTQSLMIHNPDANAFEAPLAAFMDLSDLESDTFDQAQTRLEQWLINQSLERDAQKQYNRKTELLLYDSSAPSKSSWDNWTKNIILPLLTAMGDSK